MYNLSSVSCCASEDRHRRLGGSVARAAGLRDIPGHGTWTGLIAGNQYLTLAVSPAETHCQIFRMPTDFSKLNKSKQTLSPSLGVCAWLFVST